MIPHAALPHRVTLRRYKGSTAYGPTWGHPERRIRARITGRRRMVKTSTGVDVIADATCVLRPCGEIPVESTITDLHGRTYTVLGVADNPGLTRQHNTELILQGPRPDKGV